MKRLLLPVLALLGACAGAPVYEHTFSSEAELAALRTTMKRDFHARGSAAMDRLAPDEVQAACNLHGNQPPEDLAKKLQDAQFAAIPFPQGNLLGDWKRGEQIAQSGRGLQWNDGPKDVAGGSCYNCHQLAAAEASHGTLGPSLLGFGRLRGNSPEMQKYAYGRIYNAKAYNLCSQMPRLGRSGTLTDAQIRDLVAYLLDPASPVNRP
jgi:sulfur-oxidizing protein SoxX